MALKNRKINTWSKPVSSLEDKPKMKASELKAAFDSNSNQLMPAVNGIIDDLTGENGAADVGVKNIANINGKNVQEVLQSIALLSQDNKQNVDILYTAEGAGKIGVKSISGVSCANVQAVLQSLAQSSELSKGDIQNLTNILNQVKAFTDSLATSGGAGKIGISQIYGISGSNIQKALESITELAKSTESTLFETGNILSDVKKAVDTLYSFSGAGKIGVMDINNISGDTVQDVLQNIAMRITTSPPPDIDCGVWDDIPVGEHNMTAHTHTNIIIDGNEYESDEQATALKEHIKNQNAHKNAVFDGNIEQTEIAVMSLGEHISHSHAHRILIIDGNEV